MKILQAVPLETINGGEVEVTIPTYEARESLIPLGKLQIDESKLRANPFMSEEQVKNISMMYRQPLAHNPPLKKSNPFGG